jgi:signal transduction histidine kinase
MSARTGGETREERLARLERLKNEFVAMVAHELREPLTTSIGYAELLLNRYEELSTDEREDALRAISRTGRRMVSLVEDMLDVTRMETGELTFVMEPIDVNALITEVLEEHGRIAQGVKIRSAPGEIPLVKGDPDRLKQVLWNFFSNAVKFSPDKGTVTVATEKRGGEVVMCVRDEGIGIPADEMPLLFGKFVRISQPGVKQRIPGTGLGLYICKRIVEGHRGRIWAESEPGFGTTFFVALPSGT